MQRRVSGFNGYTIEATDGHVGAISDILFDDNKWQLRWFVVNAGSWLFGRKILIHPTALQPPDVRQRAFPVALTRTQVEASPEIASDQPVSRQMEQDLNNYYGYDPVWSFGGEWTDYTQSDVNGWQNRGESQIGDPNLRSLTAVTGYHVHALDGDVGHLEDFLVDDETWKLESAVIDTRNWGFGHNVLVKVDEIKKIDWNERYVRLDLTSYKLKCSPAWQELSF